MQVKDLPFTKVAASEAANVLSGKSGFLSFGGAKKKLAKAIEEGKAELCEVLVVTQFWVDRQDNEIPYGAVLTKDTRELCEEGVMCISGDGFYSAPDAPYDQYQTYKVLADNEEKRRNAECKPGFVFHYFLGSEELYRLITPAFAADLKLMSTHADDNSYYDSLYSLK